VNLFSMFRFSFLRSLYKLYASLSLPLRPPIRRTLHAARPPRAQSDRRIRRISLFYASWSGFATRFWGFPPRPSPILAIIPAPPGKGPVLGILLARHRAVYCPFPVAPLARGLSKRPTIAIAETATIGQNRAFRRPNPSRLPFHNPNQENCYPPTRLTPC